MSMLNRKGTRPTPLPTSSAQVENHQAKALVAQDRAKDQAAPVKTMAPESTVRLAICVPCKDMMHSVFSHNLHSLIHYNWQKGIETRVFYNMGTLVVNQRASLVKQAQEWAATHILWLDSDMSFPFYTAYKLLSHKEAIVAGNYPTRVLPYKTVAYATQGDWESYLRHGPEQEPRKELISVDGIGMGCILTDIRVFESIGKPWFNIAYDTRTDDYLGEDMDFCMRATKAGFKIWVDDVLSRQVSHLGTYAYTHDLVK
jgi:hypothetical protein